MPSRGRQHPRPRTQMRGAPRPHQGSREKARTAQSGGPPPPPPRRAGTETPPHKAASSPNTGSDGARELTPATSGKALSQVWEAGPALVFGGGCGSRLWPRAGPPSTAAVTRPGPEAAASQHLVKKGLCGCERPPPWEPRGGSQQQPPQTLGQARHPLRPLRTHLEEQAAARRDPWWARCLGQCSRTES